LNTTIRTNPFYNPKVSVQIKARLILQGIVWNSKVDPSELIVGVIPAPLISCSSTIRLDVTALTVERTPSLENWTLATARLVTATTILGFAEGYQGGGGELMPRQDKKEDQGAQIPTAHCPLQKDSSHASVLQIHAALSSRNDQFWIGTSVPKSCGVRTFILEDHIGRRIEGPILR
jgi:hypothetical protein